MPFGKSKNVSGSRTVTLEELNEIRPFPTLILRGPRPSGPVPIPPVDQVEVQRGQSSPISNAPSVPSVVSHPPQSEIREKSSPAVTNMQIRQLREEAAQMSKNFRQDNEAMIIELNETTRDESDAKKSQKNVERFQQQREKTKVQYLARYDQLTQTGLRAMEQMSPEQQEEFIAFWDQVGQFLVDLLDWSGRAAETVAELILAGHSIDADVTKQFFAKAYEAMDSVSKELERFMP